jgi:hypothetical protein
MALYYAIGCNKHKESSTVLRSSSVGMSPGPSFDDFFDFMQRHEYCTAHVQFFGESDPRYDEYDDAWQGKPLRDT